MLEGPTIDREGISASPRPTAHNGWRWAARSLEIGANRGSATKSALAPLFTLSPFQIESIEARTFGWSRSISHLLDPIIWHGCRGARN